MAFQFPSSPTIGQTITNPTSSVIYTWNGVAWTSTPVTASRAITSSYANSGGSVTISDTAPSGVGTGSLWLNSNNMGLYVNYYDTDGAQWVATSTPGPVITASFAVSASSATTAQTSTTSVTASYALNGAIAYLIPNTSTTAQWVLLGTWTTFQDGCTLKININAHAGFNAQNSQNQVTELNLVTSNGISTNPSAVGGNFYLTGLASRNAELGTQTVAPGQFRIVQNSATSYLVYAYFGTFSANSHYTVSVSPGTTWINSGTLPGITPGGTYLDIFPAQLGGMAYATFRFTAFPTTVNTDFTPIINTNSSGITLSGNNIVLSNTGIYYLSANIPMRSTFAEYLWTDTSNVTLTGTTIGVAGSMTSTDPMAASPATGIISVNAGTQIKIRTGGNVSGIINSFQQYASAQIIQIR